MIFRLPISQTLLRRPLSCRPPALDLPSNISLLPSLRCSSIEHSCKANMQIINIQLQFSCVLLSTTVPRKYSTGANVLLTYKYLDNTLYFVWWIQLYTITYFNPACLQKVILIVMAIRIDPKSIFPNHKLNSIRK